VAGLTGPGTVSVGVAAGPATDPAGNASTAGPAATVTYSTGRQTGPTKLVDLVAVGAGEGGGPNVLVYDSATGALKYSFYAYDPKFIGGVRVATGDVTGDGIDDIITGAGIGGAPHVKVFDGATGAEVRSFYAYDSGFPGGVFVAAADVTGDGVADIITGIGPGGGPHVKVFDGVTGAEVRSFYAYDPSFAGGIHVAGGDLNGDGRAEVVTAPGGGGGPNVKVFDGATGALLSSFFAYAPDFTGGVSVAVGDVAGQGRPQIITGTGPGTPATVKVFDTATGAELQSFFAFGAGFDGGATVATADGADGRTALVVGSGANGDSEVKVILGADTQPARDDFVFSSLFRGGVFVG